MLFSCDLSCSMARTVVALSRDDISKLSIGMYSVLLGTSWHFSNEVIWPSCASLGYSQVCDVVLLS